MPSNLEMGEAHYHRCSWCGSLEWCGYAVCWKEDGPPEDEKVNALAVFPTGGHCDRDCYDHKRPRGAQYDVVI
jgi:hypothetical protein